MAEKRGRGPDRPRRTRDASGKGEPRSRGAKSRPERGERAETRAPRAEGRTAPRQRTPAGAERSAARSATRQGRGRPSVPLGPMRIQRALARSGVTSRRSAEELVASGRVRVNGELARIGQSVDPARDEITVDGKRIAAPATVAEAEWIVLHKPAGVMTTRRDPEGRRTVFDLVPEHPGLTYVGRLDLLTEGVLLLTTDGEAAHKLTHPSQEVERTYVAHVRGDADLAAERAMEEGVELEDGFVQPRRATAKHLGRGRWLFEVSIAEGRNREVRRLCEMLGLQVDRLIRTKFGPVELGTLEPGRSRGLTPRERTALERLLGRRR